MGLLAATPTCSFAAVGAANSQIDRRAFYRLPVRQERVTEIGEEQAAFESLFEKPAEAHGWDARLLGIRAQESDKRDDCFESDGSAVPIGWEAAQPAAAPILHLRTRDIWAYIVEHDLEYHDIYDEQDNLLGLEWAPNPGVWYSD